MKTHRPIHTPKIGFLVRFDPRYLTAIIMRSPKRTNGCDNTSFDAAL